jgi:hypothetical protein
VEQTKESTPEQHDYVRDDIQAARDRLKLAERELTAARYALGQYPKHLQ